MTRRDYGDQYSFISIAHFKVCTTHDWHFDSDDEKYAGGNYFTEPAARACFAAIVEAYGEQREKIIKAKESNRTAFINACCALVKKVKPNAKHKRIAEALVKAHQEYTSTASKIRDEWAEVHRNIETMIAESPKTTSHGNNQN